MKNKSIDKNCTSKENLQGLALKNKEPGSQERAMVQNSLRQGSGSLSMQTRIFQSIYPNWCFTNADSKISVIRVTRKNRKENAKENAITIKTCVKFIQAKNKTFQVHL